VTPGFTTSGGNQLHGITMAAAPPTPSHTLPLSFMNIRLDANTVCDHPMVIQALQEGWTVHIPLTLLSNEKRRSALFVESIGTKCDLDKSLLAFETASEPHILSYLAYPKHQENG
jgi:hypothetical protein